MAKDINSIFFDITPEIEELALKCETNNAIDKELYTKYEVKRGLRDLNGGNTMLPVRIHAVWFSATGTTKKTVTRIARRLADALGAAYEEYDYTLPAARQQALTIPAGGGLSHLCGPCAQSADALSAGYGPRQRCAGRTGGAVWQPQLRRRADGAVPAADGGWLYLCRRRGVRGRAQLLPHTGCGPSQRGGSGGNGCVCR